MIDIKKSCDKYLIDLSPIIDHLTKQNKYIEAFFILFQVLEMDLKILIQEYYQWQLNLLDHHKFYYKNEYYEEIRSKELGTLIKIFGSFNNNNDLIKELNRFNDIRIRTIHHIYEIQDISDYNKFLKKEYSRFYKLLFTISELKNKIIKKELSSYKRKFAKLRKKYTNTMIEK